MCRHVEIQNHTSSDDGEQGKDTHAEGRFNEEKKSLEKGTGSTQNTIHMLDSRHCTLVHYSFVLVRLASLVGRVSIDNGFLN